MRADPYVVPQPGAPAGFGPRFGAIIVDAIVLFIGLAILGGILYAADPFTSDAVYNVVGWLLGTVYYAFGYSSVMNGQTLGKRALKLRVVSVDSGEPISFGRALLRVVGTLISALPLGLGYLWVLWDPAKRAWHDHIAGTEVVHLAAQAAAAPTPQLPPIQPYAPARAPCPRCGESIPVNARVCRFCGLEFEPPPTSTQPPLGA